MPICGVILYFSRTAGQIAFFSWCRGLRHYAFIIIIMYNTTTAAELGCTFPHNVIYYLRANDLFANLSPLYSCHFNPLYNQSILINNNVAETHVFLLLFCTSIVSCYDNCKVR